MFESALNLPPFVPIPFLPSDESALVPAVEVIDGKPTMTSLELVDFINKFRQAQAAEAGQPFPSKGFAELRHDHFMEKVPEVLGAVTAPNFRDCYQPTPGGRKYPCYRFPKREACLMAMSYSYELQAAVYDRMTALEEQSRGPQIPDFTDPVVAARAWADEVERAGKAEALAAAEAARADEAIRTKNWISGKQQATAMATASAAVRKANKLEEDFGFGKNYTQVRGIPWLPRIFDLSKSGAYSQIGKKLSELSARMGYSPRNIQDEKYGIVKSYHVVVQDAFREQLDNDPNLLAKYRKG